MRLVKTGWVTEGREVWIAQDYTFWVIVGEYVIPAYWEEI